MEYMVRVPFPDRMDKITKDTLLKVALHALERGIMAEVARSYTFSGRRVGKSFEMTAKGE